jgi:hypothetical protein
VKPETYFEELPVIMKEVPPLPGEQALYGWINSVWEAAAKDPATKQALVESFVAADKEIIAPFIQWKYNGRSAGNGWNSPVNNAKWGTDYLNRTGTARSNMFDNKPEETKYIYRDYDSEGSNSTAGIPTRHLPERSDAAGQGVLVVDALQRISLLHAQSAGRYSLGTKNKNLQYNATVR